MKTLGMRVGVEEKKTKKNKTHHINTNERDVSLL